MEPSGARRRSRSLARCLLGGTEGRRVSLTVSNGEQPFIAISGGMSYASCMSTTSTQYQYLAPNPKSAYKQLFVKGTRIRARVLYGWYASTEEPIMTPEQ